ncbi:MAG: hypothetical protein Ct9H90mP2_14910 [Dehalococcoidia bacterium]|nr:MAG: hypothetical protein Ct9H90mP2_14910 [Dehalococcoidia bacterium]
MIENTILKKNKEGKKANVFGLTFPFPRTCRVSSPCWI